MTKLLNISSIITFIVTLYHIIEIIIAILEFVALNECSTGFMSAGAWLILWGCYCLLGCILSAIILSIESAFEPDGGCLIIGTCCVGIPYFALSVIFWIMGLLVAISDYQSCYFGQDISLSNTTTSEIYDDHSPLGWVVMTLSLSIHWPIVILVFILAVLSDMSF